MRGGSRKLSNGDATLEDDTFPSQKGVQPPEQLNTVHL